MIQGGDDRPQNLAEHRKMKENILQNTNSIIDIEGSWSSFVPVISTTVGSITSYTATGYYKQIGTTVFVTINIQITNNGTGAGDLLSTLPITAKQFLYYSGCGREYNVTGNQIQIYIPNATQMKLKTYNNAYPVATGYNIMGSVVYEH